MAQYAQEAEIDQQIQKVLKQPLDRQTKLSRIKDIKRSSIAGQQKATSLQTVLNISNSMVGSSTLVFPVLFYQSGILLSLAVSVVIGLISCKTTQLLVTHNQKNEMDLPDTIVRILGPKWKVFFNASNVTLLWASGMIYMILICNQLYPLISQVAKAMDIHTAPLTDITFSSISYQWIGVFFILLVMPLLIQKKLGTILKLIPFGVISVMTFILFAIFKGVSNLITNYERVMDNVVWFTADFQTLAGVFALAFLIQSLIIPISKNNLNPDNNIRDIGIGFGWTWIIYSGAGVFGAFAIAGEKPQPGTSGSTLLDYFPSDDILIIIIQILLFLQLSVVYPVLQFITRSQFFGLFYELDRCPKWQFYAFTLTYALSCLLVQCLEVDLSLIISLCGAVIGLSQEYIIPLAIHLTCLYAKDSKVRAVQNIQSAYQSSSQSDNLIDNVDLTQLSLDDTDIECNDHTAIKQRMSKVARISFYSVIFVIGIAIGIGKVMQIITG